MKLCNGVGQITLQLKGRKLNLDQTLPMLIMQAVTTLLHSFCRACCLAYKGVNVDVMKHYRA